MSFRLLFFLFLGSLSSQAQNALVQGSIPLLPGREVRLIAVMDPVSKTEEILDIDSVSTDGKFELRTPLENYKSLIISINRYKAPVYIGPGDTLILEFSSEQKYKLADSWLKGDIDYLFTKTDQNGVNIDISRFDGTYYFFFVQNAALIGTAKMKTKIKEFEANQVKQDSAHPFVRVYTKYSVAEMKLSNGFKRKAVYEEYLAEDSIFPSNPAWFSFFETFYSDYLNAFDNRHGGAALYNQLNSGISTDSLNTLLDQDKYVERPEIRQLVLLKSIAEVYNSKKYQKPPLREVLMSIVENPESAFIKTAAINLEEKWDDQDEKIDLEYIKNEYASKLEIYTDSLPTLLITSLSGGSQLLKEILVIEDLLARYPNIFRVVELHIGVNFSSRSRQWPMVMIDKNYAYLSDFQIFSIPHFMWFDGSNKLEFNPVTMPSEGLEELLYKLKAEQEQENKIKIGK